MPCKSPSTTNKIVYKSTWIKNLTIFIPKAAKNTIDTHLIEQIFKDVLKRITIISDQLQDLNNDLTCDHLSEAELKEKHQSLFDALKAYFGIDLNKRTQELKEFRMVIKAILNVKEGMEDENTSIVITDIRKSQKFLVAGYVKPELKLGSHIHVAIEQLAAPHHYTYVLMHEFFHFFNENCRDYAYYLKPFWPFYDCYARPLKLQMSNMEKQNNADTYANFVIDTTGGYCFPTHYPKQPTLFHCLKDSAIERKQDVKDLFSNHRPLILKLILIEILIIQIINYILNFNNAPETVSALNNFSRK